MKDIIVSEAETGIRLDKYLEKLLPHAGRSFLYKMMRKKNITLNAKKADGSERLCTRDHIRIFFSDETYEQFRRGNGPKAAGAVKTFKQPSVCVIYEDSEMLIADKPAGLLTQRAEKTDNSLNDWLCAYVRTQTDEGKKETGRLNYTPSAVNRLDRNTSGLVLCAKTYQAARELSRLIHDRRIGKYYLAIVMGQISMPRALDGFLVKDNINNRVTVVKDGTGEEIHTAYTPLFYLERHDLTLILVQLITGKPHQIRAHLMDSGHPVCGDPKYGNAGLNRALFNKYGIRRQLLHAFALTFPETTTRGEKSPSPLAGKTVITPPPQDFKKLLQSYPIGDFIWQRGIQEDFAVPLLRI